VSFITVATDSWEAPGGWGTQTVEIGALALDNDVGFAFAKSGQSRVLFRDWIVGSVVVEQIRNARSVTAQG